MSEAPYKSEESPRSSENRWIPVENGYSNNDFHAALGRVDPRIYQFNDNEVWEITDIGIRWGVSQNSAGFTGVFALPLENYTVEAYRPDAEQEDNVWVVAEPGRSMFYDGGKMVTHPNLSFDQISNFGNPGVRGGVVRVTDPVGLQKYYSLQANFTGREDAWDVRASIAEVIPGE